MQSVFLNNKPKYKLVINNFEGPLDLLLHLISKHKMNIFDISLSELTDRYIEYLEKMNDNNLEATSEFIVMASTLLDIKARKLLPELQPKEDEEEIISEEDIIQRIIEYKKYKEVSNIIRDMYKSNFGSFRKDVEKIKYKVKREYTGGKIEADSLYNLYTNILLKNENKINKKSKEIEKIALFEKFTVKSKVKQIVNYLKSNKNMVFNQVFNPAECDNIEVVTAFLGVLELSKLNQVSIEQDYLFSDINVNQKNDNIIIDLSNFSE